MQDISAGFFSDFSSSECDNSQISNFSEELLSTSTKWPVPIIRLPCEVQEVRSALL